MTSTFTIEKELRPCLLYRQEEPIQKALFHMWTSKGDDIFALLELESGDVTVVPAKSIQFLDSGNKFHEYCWMDSK